MPSRISFSSLHEGRFAGRLGTQREMSEAETPFPEYKRQVGLVAEDIALGRNRLASPRRDRGQGPGAGEPIRRPALSLTAPEMGGYAAAGPLFQFLKSMDSHVVSTENRSNASAAANAVHKLSVLGHLVDMDAHRRTAR